MGRPGRPKGVKNGQGQAFDYRRGRHVRGVDDEWDYLRFHADKHGLEFKECLRQAILEYLENRSDRRNQGAGGEGQAGRELRPAPGRRHDLERLLDLFRLLHRQGQHHGAPGQ